MTQAQLIRSPLLDGISGVAHGFTTRHGGVSLGPLASLNLARRPGETDERLLENWGRAVRAVHRSLEPSRVALLSQVHGARVVRVECPRGVLDVHGEADALITTEPWTVLAVRAADCVPVLVWSPRGVAAIHSGWRGTAAGVAQAAVRALAEATDDEPREFRAAVGPHISQAAYAVGEEVVDGLLAAGVEPNRFLVRAADGKAHVDLGAAVEEQLRAAGVVEIDRLAVCTHGDPRVYSHRGEGPETGRHAALIARIPLRC
jgi:YfiH family protein